LLNGAFAPLKGYLGKADYDGVCDNMRLADGSLWPIPINLDVTEKFAEGLKEGDRIALRHPEGIVLAVLTVSDIWEPDREAEARQVLGTTDDDHPWVFELLHQIQPVYVGGVVEGVELPPHHTFRRLRHTPLELRAEFARIGWSADEFVGQLVLLAMGSGPFFRTPGSIHDPRERPGQVAIRGPQDLALCGIKGLPAVIGVRITITYSTVIKFMREGTIQVYPNIIIAVTDKGLIIFPPVVVYLRIS